jgi:hypothetical protein
LGVLATILVGSNIANKAPIFVGTCYSLWEKVLLMTRVAVEIINEYTHVLQSKDFCGTAIACCILYKEILDLGDKITQVKDKVRSSLY